MTLKPKIVLGVALTAVTTLAQAQGSTLLMSYSLDSLKGKFGQTEETKVTSATVGATLVGESWRASLFVPYVSVSGPGSLAGGTVTSTAQRVNTKTSGIADSVASLSLDVIGSAAQKGGSMGTTLLVKLPTGDEKEGLGTGEVDYGLQLDLGYRFGSSFGLTANLGRMNYGDSPDFPLLDGNYHTLGLNLGLTDKLTMAVSATSRDAIVQGGEKRKERSMTGIYALASDMALQVSYLTGSGRSSPDSIISAGLIVQHD